MSARISKKRQGIMDVSKRVGEILVKQFMDKHPLSPGWGIEYLPGKPVSNYTNGGARYEYDSVVIRFPKRRKLRDSARGHGIIFPSALDDCSQYRGSDKKRVAVGWVEVLEAACWELREWVLEIGIPRARESDLNAMLGAS